MTLDMDLLTRLQETALECRELIKVMHQAQRDLSVVIKEAKSVHQTLERYLQESLIPKTLAGLDSQMEKLQKDVTNHIDLVCDSLVVAFDKKVNRVVSLGTEMLEDKFGM